MKTLLPVKMLTCHIVLAGWAKSSRTKVLWRSIMGRLRPLPNFFARNFGAAKVTILASGNTEYAPMKSPASSSPPGYLQPHFSHQFCIASAFPYRRFFALPQARLQSWRHHLSKSQGLRNFPPFPALFFCIIYISKHEALQSSYKSNPLQATNNKCAA